MLREFQREINELKRILEEGKGLFCCCSRDCCCCLLPQAVTAKRVALRLTTAAPHACRRGNLDTVTRVNFHLALATLSSMHTILDSNVSISPRNVALMKAELEKERARLLASKDMAEGERNQAQKELEEREQELKTAQEQQLELERKLKELNSKVV